MPCLFQPPSRRVSTTLAGQITAGQISTSKILLTQISMNQASSSWISVNSAPLSHPISQFSSIESQYPPWPCLCPLLPRQPRLALQPLSRNRSRCQRQPRRKLTVGTLSSFPLGKTSDSPIMPTTPSLFAQVCHELVLKKEKRLNSLSGVPGTYLCPPTPSGDASSCLYFAVTKGLYVGIFTNW